MLVSVLIHGQSRHQIATEHGVTRQNIAQIVDKAIDQIRPLPGPTGHSPLAAAIAAATHTIDAAGLELAYKVKSRPRLHADTVVQQLINISAISPQERTWAIALIAITPPPAKPRPSLKGLSDDARQVAAQHLRGVSPRHLRSHLQDWQPTMAAWPNFDLKLHLAAITGIHPDRRSGRYHPVKDWTTPVHNDSLLIKHYVARALDKAGRPLNFQEITELANHLAQTDGTAHTYSESQIKNLIHCHKHFKWVGPSTWALASWDVGHSQGATEGSRRVKISDEILHVLQTSTEPVTYDQIKDHILSRFQVVEGAVRATFELQHGKRRFIINPDGTIGLNPDANTLPPLK